MIETLLMWQFIWLPLGLLVFFPIVIQHKRGGYFRILLVPCSIALVVDVWLNYTTLAMYSYDFPASSEWTFSKRLKRLQFYPGLRGFLARMIAYYLNYFDKGHV